MNDFAYRLDLLRRLNAVVIDGVPVAHTKVLGRYNAWHCFQNRIFYGDLKAFCERTWKPDRHAKRPFSAALFSLFASVITRAALLSLAARRPALLIYSMDKVNSKRSKSDARLDVLYDAVFEAHARFIEVFHVIIGRGFVENFLHRKRFAVYDVGIRVRTRAIRPIDWEGVDLSDFTEEEKPVVRDVIEKYLAAVPRLEARAQRYARVLRGSSVRLILAIDDTRSYNELMLGAQLAGTPAYAVQHGHYTKYHLGWLRGDGFDGEIIRPDRLYVWSDYWRDELLRLGTYFSPESIVVGGLKEIPSPRTSRADAVVVPYEADSDKHAVKACVDTLLACGIPVLFKLRSDRDAKGQLAEYGFESREGFTATADQDEAVKRAGLVIGTYSTYLYDMLSLGCPAAILETSSDFGEGMVVNGLADKLTLGASLCADVRALVALSPEEVGKRRTKLIGDHPLQMRETLRALL